MAATAVVIDTGPLVALLDRTDVNHAWASTALAACPTPFLTCGAVISETFYLLATESDAPRRLRTMLQTGALRIVAFPEEDWDHVLELMIRYHDLPMSVADGCLVCLSERFPRAHVATCDSDFQIYRRHRNQIIPLLMPGR